MLIARPAQRFLAALVVVLAFTCAGVLAAEALALPKNKAIDRSFGVNGFARVPVPASRSSQIGKCVEDSRGNIVMDASAKAKGKRTRNFIASLTRRGAARRSFGRAGRIQISADAEFEFDRRERIYVKDIARRKSGRYHRITRYTARGKLDKNYGKNGSITLNVKESNGEIVDLFVLPSGQVAVNQRVAIDDWYPPSKLTRVSARGKTIQVDRSRDIDNHGMSIDLVSETAAGQILIAGTDPAAPERPNSRVIKRFSKSGTIDSSWGKGGTAEVGSASNALLRSISGNAPDEVASTFWLDSLLKVSRDGAILVGVGLSDKDKDASDSYHFVLRITKNGFVDAKYGRHGANHVYDSSVSDDGDGDYSGSTNYLTADSVGRSIASSIGWSGESYYAGVSVTGADGRKSSGRLQATFKKFEVRDVVWSTMRKRAYVCGVSGRRGYVTRLKTK